MATKAPFFMESRYGGNCMNCHKTLLVGSRIKYHPALRKAQCETCGTGGSDWIVEEVEEQTRDLDARYALMKR